MNRNRSLAIGGAFAFSVTVGCSPAQPTHTTAWYSEHPDAARARLEVCDRAGFADRDADCLNAQQGAVLAAIHGKSTVNPWAK